MPAPCRPPWLSLCALAVAGRIAHLHARYDSVFETRRAGPVRGIVDAAIDAHMMVATPTSAVVIHAMPALYAADDAKRDFDDFCARFVALCEADGVAPTFNVPINDGRCAALVVERASLVGLAALPVPVDDVPSYVARHRLRLLTRGVARQVAAGVCPESPLSHEFGRASGAASATAHNAAMLSSVARHVHVAHDPLGHVARWLHLVDAPRAALTLAWGACAAAAGRALVAACTLHGCGWVGRALLETALPTWLFVRNGTTQR